MRLVERGADQVVHGGVGDHEGLFAVALHVEHARHQRPGLGDEKAARLDEQAAVETAERLSMAAAYSPTLAAASKAAWPW